MKIGQKGYRIFRICTHVLVVLTLSTLIFLSLVFPYEDSRYLELVHSEVQTIDQEHFILVRDVKQKYPVPLGGDISISFELVNTGKGRISSTKIWLGFMHRQGWGNIPDLEPGETNHQAFSLPYPADGMLNKQDKLIDLWVDGIQCNIKGFYVYLDTFAPGTYRPANKFVHELNVLVVSPKPAIVRDLIENIRALEPQRYERIYARPLGDSSLIGTSLRPMFGLQLWEVAAVEPIEKNRFYFETLINGSWRDQTLYTLDNRFLKAEAQPTTASVDTVLFIVSDDAPADAVRGVSVIWRAAVVSHKHPLLLVVNETDSESLAAKYNVPPSDVRTVLLKKFPSHADVQILRPLHQLIIRGETTLMQKQNLTLSDQKSPIGNNARFVVSTLLLAVYVSLLIYRLQYFYNDVFHFKSKEEAPIQQVTYTDFVVQNEVKYEVARKERIEPRVDSQGNFANQIERDPLSLSDMENSDDSDAEGYHETSAIYSSIEHLIGEDTRKNDELDITNDDLDDAGNSSADVVALTPDSDLVAPARKISSEEVCEARKSESEESDIEEFEELDVAEEKGQEEKEEVVEKSETKKDEENRHEEQKDKVDSIEQDKLEQEEKEQDQKEEYKKDEDKKHDEQKSQDKKEEEKVEYDKDEGKKDEAEGKKDEAEEKKDDCVGTTSITEEGQMEEIQLSKLEKFEEENVQSQLTTLLTSDFAIIDNYKSSLLLESEAPNPLQSLAKIDDVEFTPAQ